MASRPTFHRKKASPRTLCASFKELKSIKRDVPIVLHSGSMPSNLQNIDVYINKDESTSGFLRIVSEVVRRFCS
jgi:hypothetical protein